MDKDRTLALAVRRALLMIVAATLKRPCTHLDDRAFRRSVNDALLAIVEAIELRFDIPPSPKHH